MNPSDPKPPFDPVAFMLDEVYDELTSRRFKVVLAEDEVRYSIAFDWRPPWVMDLRWRADPGALGVRATVSGLATADRPIAEIQAGFDEAAMRKPDLFDELFGPLFPEFAESFFFEARLMPTGPSVNSDGDVCYDIVVELLLRDLTRPLIVAMARNAADVLMNSIWWADLSEPIHEP